MFLSNQMFKEKLVVYSNNENALEPNLLMKKVPNLLYLKYENHPPDSMGTTRRLTLSFKNTPLISVRLFSSSAALIRRSWTDCECEPEKIEGESAVYRRALKLQRPTTVHYQKNLRNSVSLIGEIDRPLKACNSDSFGVHTLLKVRAPACPYRGFT